MKIKIIAYIFLLVFFAFGGYFLYQLSQKTTSSTPTPAASANVTPQDPAIPTSQTSARTDTPTSTATVHPTSTNTPIPFTPTVNETPVTCMSVLIEGVRLRSGPGDGYFKIYDPPKGTPFKVIGRSADKQWFVVELPTDENNGTGWAPVKSFEEGCAVDQLRVYANPTLPTQVTPAPGPVDKTPGQSTPTVTPPTPP